MRLADQHIEQGLSDLEFAETNPNPRVFKKLLL